MVKQITVLERYTATKKSLDCLKKSLDILHNDPIAPKYYEQFRNSAIQCFEFSFDTLWKLLKEYIALTYQIEIQFSTPKATFQESFNLKIITQDEIDTCFDIVNARNITSHTYNETVAEQISKKLPKYYDVMKNIISKIKL